MVALGDIRRINALYRESGANDRALQAIADGQAIRSMTIGNAEVSTEHIATPPMMMDAVRVALEARQAAITAELRGLGVDVAA